MLQVRLELTTSASPAHILLYKYRALTNCATGACFRQAARARSTESDTQHAQRVAEAGARHPGPALPAPAPFPPRGWPGT